MKTLAGAKCLITRDNLIVYRFLSRFWYIINKCILLKKLLSHNDTYQGMFTGTSSFSLKLLLSYASVDFPIREMCDLITFNNESMIATCV